MRTVLNAAGDALARSGAADLGALVLEQVEARRSSGCGSRFLAEHNDYKDGTKSSQVSECLEPFLITCAMWRTRALLTLRNCAGVGGGPPQLCARRPPH